LTLRFATSATVGVSGLIEPVTALLAALSETVGTQLQDAHVATDTGWPISFRLGASVAGPRRMAGSDSPAPALSAIP